MDMDPMRVSKLLLVLLSVTSWSVSRAFVNVPLPFAGWKQTQASRATSTGAFILNYRNDTSAPLDESTSRQQQGNKEKDNGIFTIPVLGPFPGHAPLIMGADLLLNPPTPMQWQSLEEAVYTHQRHFKKQANNKTNLGTRRAASIDAAPLVAIMDDYTTGDVQLPGTKQNGRYATIAAVVGISSNNNNMIDNGQLLDTSDQISFMESIMRIGRSATPLNSKIRLVGIGRACLYDFFYQVPTCQQEAMDEEGHLIMDKSGKAAAANVDDDDDDDEEEEETNLATNIVMANFRLVTDLAARSEVFQNDRGRMMHASPMHAMAEMSNLANKIQRTHDDRRRYVAGLQAAKSRMQRAAMAREEAQDEEDFEDYDNLGMLFSDHDGEEDEDPDAAQPAIEQFLTDFQRDAPVEHTRLVGLENYGMGYSSASISTIIDLTSVWTEKLEPYYSPSRCESEEHHFEVLSFVSFLSMDKYLDPYELGWALRCTNTIERLQKAHEYMWDHVRLLKQESEKISQELRDCGEECTDLW
jgi:hypothetical protein